MRNDQERYGAREQIVDIPMELHRVSRAFWAPIKHQEQPSARKQIALVLKELCRVSLPVQVAMYAFPIIFRGEKCTDDNR
jgi:hypothetical protein